MLTLLLGGARSGKSAVAETWGRAHAAAGGTVAILATAEAIDTEMADRIDRHRADRRQDWHTIEEPVDLAAGVRVARADAFLIVDCLTTWLGNLMHYRDDDVDERATAALVAIADRTGPTVVISNEVGLGIVPGDPMSREYRDTLGRLNQHFARVADHAYLLVAGRALRLDDLLHDGPR